MNVSVGKIQTHVVHCIRSRQTSPLEKQIGFKKVLAENFQTHVLAPDRLYSRPLWNQVGLNKKFRLSENEIDAYMAFMGYMEYIISIFDVVFFYFQFSLLFNHTFQ